MKRNFTATVLVSCTLLMLGSLMYGSKADFDPLGAIFRASKEKSVEKTDRKQVSTRPAKKTAPTLATKAAPDMVCALTITQVSVSECRNDASTGNIPTALVAVSVAWLDPPPGEDIIITFDGGPTVTLDPAEDGCPAYGQFEVNLNTASPTGLISAAFSGGTCIAVDVPYVLPAPCTVVGPCGASGTMGGKVYSDFDSDGAKDASEFGIEGIQVAIFDCDQNALCTTTTDVNGNWRCTGLPNATRVRVEFDDQITNLNNGQAGPDNNGGSVQFAIVGSDCTVDFGLSDPAIYCQNNPYVITNCYVRGDPLAGGTAGTADVVLAVPYNASGTVSQNIYLAEGSEVGATWGIALNRRSKAAFASSLLKRHIGWGPDSLSAIYKIDLSTMPPPSGTGNSSLYVDLDDQFGIDAADEYLMPRDLSGNVGDPSYDPAVFDKVGKEGLGDMDISSDSDSIFVVNLKNKTVVIIENDPVTDTPLSATEVIIPDPGCSNTVDWRPWALKYQNGRLYVGGVCSAQSTQNEDDMTATVYEFDPQTGIFTTLITFDLDYPKGSPASFLANPSADCKNWNPWTNNFANLIESGIELCYPQPILSDIEFDVYGNMTVAFIDRMGHQAGWFDYGTSAAQTGTNVYKGNVGGEVLRIYNNNGHYLLEKNASAGFDEGCGDNNGQGPCGGEFYCQDSFGGSHQETAHGGLAIHPSNNEVLLNVMDPLGAFSAGLAWYNNSTGLSSRQYQIYFSGNNGTTGLFGKAAGLGDLELVCNTPSQEIGNHVFIDINRNGIQDGCDIPVQNVNVTLFRTDGTQVATTTTNSNGYFYFDTGNGIAPQTDYYIVFGKSGQWSGSQLTIAGNSYTLTSANIGSGAIPDINDSDATIAAGSGIPASVLGFPAIFVTTGAEGQSTHTYDMGLLYSVSIGSTVFYDLNDNGVYDESSEDGIAGVTLELFSAGPDNLIGGGDDVSIGTDVTDANGDYFFGDLPEGFYYVQINTPPTAYPLSSTDIATSAADNQTDNDDNGLQPGGTGTQVQSPLISLVAGSEPTFATGETAQGSSQDGANNSGSDSNGDMTVDFGFISPVSVGSTVFADLDNNGIYEPGDGEGGLPGVTLVLYTVGSTPGVTTPIATTITDSNGDYLFENLTPGSYFIHIPTPPSAYPLSSTPTDIADNQEDDDDNGAQASTGSPVNSPNFTLTPNGEPTGAAESGSGGTQDNADDDNGDMTIDFGFVPNLSIGSTVWVDSNNDGLYQEATENGVPGVALELYNTGPDNIKGSADDFIAGNDVTDGNGDYFFGNLLPGNYYVVVPSSNFNSGGGLEAYQLSSTPTNPNDDQMDNDDNGAQMNGAGSVIMSPIINLLGGTEPPVEPGSGGGQDNANDDNGDMTVDFGVIPAVSVGSNVFADNNNNGVDDGAGEPGIPGVTVELWSTGPDGAKGTADDVLAGTDVTDAGGDYYIGGLPEGEYYLKIQPSQMTAGGPLELYPLSSADVPSSSTDNPTDNDDNGLQMGGAGGMVMSPEFTLTADSEPTTEPGSGGNQDNADDNNGDMTKDFGFTPPVSVGSTVFSDLDNNGIFEPQDGENGIPGVVVTLYSTGPDGVKGNGDDVLIGTEITDSNGDYLFDGLYQGEYYLAITTTEFGAGEPLNGYGSSTVTDTNDNGDDNDDNGIAMGLLGSTYSVMSPEFTLTPNAEPTAPAEGGQGSTQDDADDNNGDMTQDFGFVQLLSIASFVWVDDNNNGQFDPGELPVNGVRILLHSPGPDGLRNTGDDFEINTGPDGLLGTADDAAGGTLTDANGVYFFGYLYPGDYYLEVPASNFAAGNALATYQLSSTPTSLSDDQVDNDDNGEQLAGAGTAILSPIINLQVGAEPTSEPGAGGNQDNSDDDNGDMTQDFGVIPAVSVGSQVFADLNNDGIFNGTDFGINGVEVQLWSTGPDGIKGNLDDELINAGPDGVPNTADDAPAGVVTSTVSGQDGVYFFSGLPEGEYYLKIQSDQMSTGGALEYYPLSSADIASSTTDNPTDNDDNGLQMGGAGGMVMSPEFTLDAGTEPTTEPGPGGAQDNTHPFVDANGDMTKDFGFTPAVSIGSTVFSDIDNDGLHEPQDGENGIPGVIVQVYSTGPNGTKENGGGDDVLVATDNTDPQGNYFVGGLYQGEYYVLITAGEFGVGEPLNGFVSSTPTDVNDNGQDEDDNGIAMGLVGTTYFVMSPEITLSADSEPVVNAEDGEGSTQDDYDDDNGDMTVDFGFVPTLSIGSTVWVDDQSGQNTTDNNGIQDAGENGLAGVTVQLFTAGPDGIKGNADDLEVNVGPDGLLGTADDAAGGMLTNASGNYYFGNLLPEVYYVKLPVANFANGGAAEAFPLSSDPTNENDDQMDGDDNGIQMGGLGGMIMSPLINLFAGTEPMGEPGQGGTQDDADDDNGDMTVDFGLIPGVSVGSNVFVDANNNGIDDGAGEPGIPGVTVELWSTGPDGLKGTADDVLAGNDVTDTNGDYFIGGLPEGEYYLKIQTDQFVAGGPLYNYPISSADLASTSTDNPTDNDDNGIQMGGAAGMVMSPEFTLTADSEPTTEPGPGGTQDNDDDDNGDMTKDFGFVPALSVGSTVFADIDNDGLFEPQDGENGIPGVTLTLYSTGPDGVKGNGDDALIGTQITDANGDYFFGGLYPGEYYIAIEAAEFGSGEPLNGFASSAPTDSNDNGQDNDDNGIEMGLLGSTYMVMSPEFILAAGTEPLVNAEDGQGSDQDDADDDNGDMTQDFGFVPVLAIGSTVFVDDLSGQNATDNNGVQDAGELGLAGVTVQLFTAGPDGIKGNADDVEVPAGPDGLMGTADDAPGGMITNAGGLYRFGNLMPGVYYVKLPVGNFATGGAAEAYPLSSEPTNENDDQMDSDDNGIQMGGSGGMIMSPLITLAAGTEPIGEPGTGGTLDDADDDNGDMTVDFGLIPAVSVGSNVFVDANNNGVDDGAGEAGVPGVTVELWHTGPDGIKGTADDQLVGSDVTDNNGDFFMGGLPEGEYYLKIQPDQLAAGGPLADYPLSSEDIATSASDNTTDADDNGLQMGGAGGMVMSPEFLLTANTEPTTEPGSGGTQDNADENNGDMTKDFGFTPAVSIGSTVFVDFDNNGLQDFNPVEVGIPGVTMELYDAGPDQLIGGGDDVLIATDVTDSNGDYFFGGLYEGKYYVQIPAAQFGAGMSLAGLPLSSVDTDVNDNQQDFDDNGAQAGGQGTTVTSPVIMLMAGVEPTGTQEDAQGGTQDDADDNNGDMTVDFGFVPIQFDLALYKTLAVGEDATVEPGDTVTFTITVVNQGNLAAANIEIFDYIPAGFSFDASLNPVWNAVVGGATTTLPGVLDINQTTSIDIVLVVDAPLPAGTTLTNLAEISGATDEFGTPQPDVDSTPNDDPDDDTFLSDNEINGNGNNGGDEDDHDPASVVVETFDLALIKLLGQGQAAQVSPGDTIHYVIRVINQGMIAADNIVVSDYVPANMTYEGGITGNNSAGWSFSGGIVSRTINAGDELPSGGLSPGDSIEVSIYLTLNNPLAAGLSVRNLAEITSATDENGDPQVDDDSTPDDTPGNDVVNQDNEVSGDANDGEDEDDHDYADISTLTFDLASIKLLAPGQGATVEPGDTVHYVIRVINQGDIAADNIELSDYVPSGMTYEGGITGNNNEGWSLSGSTVSRVLNIGDELAAGGLAPGASVEVDIFLTVNDPLPAGTNLRNFSEISDATDENGDDQIDDDSTPNDNPNDDVVNNDNDVSGDGNNGEDEDDHDYADVAVETFDLALMKLLAPGQSASVEPGDTIHYRIRVINQGTIAADNILVTDYVPANMSYETGIAGNVNWTLSGGDVQRTLSVAAGDLPVGGLAPGDSVEVSLYLTLASPLAAGTQIDNYAEVSDATDENGDDQQDVDSTPDANDTNDVLTQDNNVDGNGNNGEDEDDHDVASIVTQRFDLASIKLLAPGQGATVEPGDTVHYVIRVINQGDISADNIELSDYVPGGMTYEGGITGNNNEGWSLSGSTVSRVLNIGDELAAGGLAPGASVEVDIFLTVNDPLPAGTNLRNFSEISDATDENGDDQVDDDSTPNDNPNDDVVNNDNDVSGDGNNGEDEDDHDYADVAVETFDLALMKLTAPGQSLTVEPGDTVHYRIRVINQGTIAADNILVSDYVPAQMYFEGGISGNSGWTQVGALVQRTISVANGDLPAGGLAPTDSVEVDLYLTLNAPLPGGLSINNYAEVTDATDENGDDQIDIDSSPDANGTNDVLTQDNEVSGNGNDGEDEDDHDIATVVTEVFDLALIKELSPNEDEFVSTGDTVLYFITVINQGQIAADSIEVTDHIPTGMILVDSDWTSTAGNKATRMLNAGDELPANGLQSGQNVTVAIQLYMQDELPAGTELWNWAEISSAEDNEDNDHVDIDSEPDGTVGNDNYFEDNEIQGDGLNGEDEDDHDPAVVTMNSFDLALYKTLAPGQEQLVEPGDLVTFRITVVNQGQIPAKNVLVYDSWDVDHFVLSDPDWTFLGPPPTVGTAFASLSIADTIYPGDSYIVDITMRVKDPLPANTVMVNLAEIGYAEDIEGNVPDDIDSDPDIDRENDTYLSDNEINGNGHVDGDEDDHDPAQLVVKTFDLALVKQLGPGQSETVEPGDTVVYTIRVFNQGQIAADSIALSDYIPAGMNFDAGLNPEWSVNTAGDAAQTLLTIAEGEIAAGGLQPGDEVSVNIYLIIDAPLAAGYEFVNWAEITRATDEQGYETDDVDSHPDDIANNDTFLQDDEINGNAVAGGDEDDHDPATVVVEVFDLALYKQLSPGQSMIVEPGDTISYTIAVVNQGTIAADNIRIVDYVPTGMSFDGVLNPVWTISLGKVITDLRVSEGDLPAGGLLPGQTATVTVQLILDSPLPPGLSLTNWAEIVSATDDSGAPQQDDDSTPDSNPNNDLYLQDNDIDGDGLAGGDEDDHDPATVITEAFDLALVKLLSPGQDAVVAPGDTVSYTIQVINQGQIAADNIEVTDYLPAQLLFDNALNPGWVFISGNRARTTLRVSEGELPAGGLAPGGTATVTLQLVLVDPLPQGLQIINWAEISNATADSGDPQDDVDSNPDGINNDNYLVDNEINGNGLQGGDEDDHDQAVITTLSFDLALVKQLAPGQVYGVEPGDTVQFVITVFNQGTIPADNILVTDYLPATLNFVAALNPGWSLVGGNPTTTLSVAQGELPTGGLAPNATVDVYISLVVDNPLPPGTQIVNTAEVTSATDQNGNSVVDMDSEPDAANDDVFLQDNEISGDGLGGEDEDDHDIATVITQVFDLALIKTLEVGQLSTVGLNDTITFVIEVINQGMIAADNIQVTDYLPQGLLFFQTLNPGWSLVGGKPTATLSVANGALASTGLLPGYSVYVEINLVVGPNVAEGLELVNFAEISAATDINGDPKQDIDSTPDNIDNNDTYVSDNNVNGNGTIGEDEDDHDPAEVELECYRSAGVDTHIETCLGCSEAVVVVDFFGSLSGNPDTGGYWTDLDNSGLNLSNPSAVPVTNLAPGLYHFAYTISGINGCANRTAILELEVVSIENLVCNADINISLGENCVAEVGVDNLLEGDLPCYNALEVHIYSLTGADLGNTVTEAVIGQTLTFRVEDPMCGNHCWGTIKIEDKRKPVITCPDDTDQAMVTEQVQTISGALSAGDPQLDLDDHFCFLNLTNPVNGPHYYDLYTFTVSQPDVYTFDLNTSWGDGILALYQGSFNPDQPCANIIALGDDNLNGTFGIFDPFDPILRLSLPLEPGVQYVLMTTSFDINQTGDYSYTVYSDGNGQITGLPLTTQIGKRDLICTDVDHIYNNLLSTQYTGIATAVDNCTDPVTDITFTDLILSDGGDCGEVVIMRRFKATDESGNFAQCVQEITVRKATMDDVILPPFVVYVECDETYPTDQNGNPHPSLTGFPFLFTAFGIVELDDSYCNLGASYFDYPHAQVCEGTFEFRREWTVFNWCAPSSTIVYNQIIKVGDFSAPEVFCPAEDYDWDGTPDLLTYSTGPYDCTAVIEAPLPQVVDNCSSTQIITEVVHVATVDVTNQYGQVIGTTQQEILVATIAHDAPRFVANLEIGTYFFRYIVTDACNHLTVIECPFRVIDDIAPIAICDDDLHISIGGEGYAQVSAEDIDEGSWDNCSPVRLEVRRSYAHNDDCEPVEPYFGNWSDIVDFGCCDVNDNVTIELRVWEDADHDGLWGAWYGNPDLDGDGYPDVDTLDDKSNVCWQEVLIEDKLKPYCTAPHNVTITCDELPYNFPRETSQATLSDTLLLQQLFGHATGTDNCPGAQVKELAPIWDLECGSGIIIRRFSVTDAVGNVSTNTCQQIITIQKIHNYEIKFPKDASANCGTPHPDTISVADLGCDLLAVSVDDELFTASGDECYKIFRTYRVINWCEYNGTDDPIIVSRDEDCDNNPGDEDIWVLVRQSGVGGQKVTYYDRNNNEGDNVPAPFTKNPSCDGRTNPAGYWMNSVPGSYGTAAITSRGYWEYTQVIKVYDNIQPVITAEATEPFCSYSSDIAEDCPGEVEVPFTVDENCTPDDLEITIFLDAFSDGVLDGDITAASLTGNYPDYVIVGNFPLGQHQFEVHVHDGCGNVNALEIPFEVVDCKAPTPICINGLTIELMPVVPVSDVDGDGIADTGAMTIWASDFVSSAVEDCTGPVRYSIHIADEVTNGSNIPDPSQTSLILTCADPSTTIIRIYAWDSAYNPYAVQPDGTVGGPNFDFCETYVIIQDNMFDVCPDVVPGSGMIAGVIATPNDEVVEGVAVDLSGQAVMNYATALDGQFSFNNLQTGYDYTVTPQLDSDPLNGVSTFDIILITKHILTTQPLDNPYDMIAADANNSKTITVQDIILIRKLILTLEDNFPTNTSWRFVPAAYEFPVPTNPWFEDFPEVINVNDLSGQLMGQDFVAIKIGDINSSALTTLASIEERDVKGLYEIITNDIELKVGEEYEVQLRADQLSQIQGWQGTLLFDASVLEFKDINYGAIQPSHVGLRHVADGAITMSWNDPAGTNGSGVDQLASLIFKAKQNARLSQVLGIGSRYTRAEAYNAKGELLNLGLQFRNRAEEPYALYQNMPNPFSKSTVIGFYLPEASNADLIIQSVDGKVIKRIEAEYAKGYHQVLLDASELSRGVMFYTLTTGNFSATRKMILVE